MIYDLSMPHEDFDRADALVRDITRRCYTRELTLITQASYRLNKEDQAYISADPGVLGVTFMDIEAKQFRIWLSPSFRHWDSPWALDTLLHELIHGYANCMDHGQRFRRTLIKVLHRYEKEVQPVKADFMARRMVNRYSEDSWEARQLELDFCKKAALKESQNAKTLVSV